jgi:hypothetical protein
MTTLTPAGIKLALLDGIKQEDERTLSRQIERLREKQAQLHHIQREAKHIAQSILVTQRQIAAITDEMANLIARREIS